MPKTSPSTHRYYIFDFDSTLVQLESLPELARISLKNHPERAERVNIYCGVQLTRYAP